MVCWWQTYFFEPFRANWKDKWINSGDGKSHAKPYICVNPDAFNP